MRPDKRVKRNGTPDHLRALGPAAHPQQNEQGVRRDGTGSLANDIKRSANTLGSSRERSRSPRLRAGHAY
jgi:hypothetical protein